MNPAFWIDFDLPCESKQDEAVREKALQACVLARRRAPIMADRAGNEIGHYDTKEWMRAREEFARLGDKYLAAENAAWVCYARQYELSEYREAKASFEAMKL